MNLDTLRRSPNKVSATELDRAMEDYAQKLLSGEANDTDTAEYQRLLKLRKSRLVKLSPRTSFRIRRPLKRAS